MDSFNPTTKTQQALSAAVQAATSAAQQQTALREQAVLSTGLSFTVADAVAPESQAFHAADVLDRVLQVHHHARAAAFTADQALDDLDLVHEGPVQAFHLDVLRSAGL